MLKRCAIAFTLVAALLSAHPGFAQSTSEARERIEALHGNSDGFDDSFKLLTEAMRFGDPVTVANLGAYPLTVNANGETYEIQSEDDMVENYEKLVMQETQNSVAEQTYGDLIVNSDGVGFANGALWMSAICDTDDCSVSHWAITSINN
ncbi:hypothetical protein C8J35_101608 [Rhizobium sp. PP-F2F-G38]|nr:hypothetical protein C8J37_101609 [Rhizobium sp. PP-WC-1G-195]PYF00789.1 hypothetical protein C8J35_101608 [Rhizobium sp. PP-F2F-G38]